MVDLNLVTEILKQLLSARNPELGARLKQRLNSLLIERGLDRFDERELGFRKFQDFLERSQSHWLHVTKPAGSGDISVFVRKEVETPARFSTGAPSSVVGTPIRSDLWQAFTNPDPKRKRYFNKGKAIVRHFVDGEHSDASQEVADAPGDFAQVVPIEGLQQQVWMREFLDSIPVTGSERAAYDAMLSEPYSSALNVTFTRAIGVHANAWREYRTKRVTDHILEWARTTGIASEKLRSDHRPTAVSAPHEVSSRAVPVSARDKATKLLDLLSDEDIARLVIPILLSTIMVKTRV